MKLSNRLKTIADLITSSDVVADVGCDHGLLAIHLIHHQQVTNIFVSDINEAALASAQSNINKYQLQQFITPILANGIEWINNYPQINCVIIAGLGTAKILKILKDDANQVQRYVIQTNTNAAKIRQWIKTNNFYLETEILVKDKGRIYEILVINKTNGYQIETEDAVIFGVKLATQFQDLFNEQWQQKLWHYQNIVNNLSPMQQTTLPTLINLITTKIKTNSHKGQNNNVC